MMPLVILSSSCLILSINLPNWLSESKKFISVIVQASLLLVKGIKSSKTKWDLREVLRIRFWFIRGCVRTLKQVFRFSTFSLQILGVSLIVLSIMSWTAYLCGFDFQTSSVSYMLYLIYYRAGKCHSDINWRFFEGIGRNVSLVIQVPEQTEAVLRTYVFSLSYLVISIFLVITCVLAIRESFTDKIENFINHD